MSIGSNSRWVALVFPGDLPVGDGSVKHVAPPIASADPTEVAPAAITAAPTPNTAPTKGPGKKCSLLGLSAAEESAVHQLRERARCHAGRSLSAELVQFRVAGEVAERVPQIRELPVFSR